MQKVLLSLKERDDIFSPETSGHVRKLLPTIFLQRVSEKEEAREGEGAFSQMLGCLDVKDAFLQDPQEKTLKVNLRGGTFGEEELTWTESWSKSMG